jgi:uncharacterized protein YigE (DUF2233 family)
MSKLTTTTPLFYFFLVVAIFFGVCPTLFSKYYFKYLSTTSHSFEAYADDWKKDDWNKKSWGEGGWRLIEADLEVRQEAGFWPEFMSPTIYLVRTSLDKFNVRVLEAKQFGQPVLSSQEFARKSGATLVINANFFDHNNKPLGLVLNRGIQNAPIHWGGNTLGGVFAISQNGPLIVHRDYYHPKGLLEALQAGPRLIVGGKKSTIAKTSSRSPRSSVCIDGASRIIFAATSRWALGVTLIELQDLLHRVGCQEALNLDGGGSAQISFNPQKSRYELNILGQDKVPVALGLFRN